MDIEMDLHKIINQERSFTLEEREKAMQYLMWYTCCYHREQLDKLSERMVSGFHNFAMYNMIIWEGWLVKRELNYE